MQAFLLNNEMLVRVAAFVTVFILMAVAEIIAPRRRVGADRRHRWPVNLSMVFIGTVAIRAAIPLLAVEAALQAQTQNFGLFNRLALPWAIEFIISLLLLDLAIYAQHLAFHHVPWLWRIHRMHHSDLTLDVTSGVRFHPIELVLSMLIKVGVVSVLGLSAAAVIAFEIILNATAMFNHSNLRLPKKVDQIMRCFVVTPDFHVVHHSVIRAEHDRNFGFNLPWWDYLFGTYKAAPDKGIDQMDIGLSRWRNAQELRFERLLWMPFVKDTDKQQSPQSGS